MSENYKVRNPDGIYFITSTIVNWIDLFAKEKYRKIILDSLNYSIRNKGLVVHAWCIMPNHIHLVISRRGDCELYEMVRDFKKFTSRKISELLEVEFESRRDWLLEMFERAAFPLKRIKYYKVWRDGFHPVELFSNSMIDQRINYIHMNPVKAGLVQHPEYYLYSSAMDYCGEKGLLEVELL